MEKIAIVNQRYGLEVNGGSEYFTRLLAEKLNNYYDVTVLTTKAIDYNTWADHYKEDNEIINGVKVKRFGVKKQRNIRFFFWIYRILMKIPCRIGWFEELWLKEQGPYSSDFIKYIEESGNEYDVFLFVTYLYYLTAKGLPKVCEKSILIPTAHEEPCINIHLFKKIFESNAGMIFLTEEEEQVVRNHFNIKQRTEVAGVGMELLETMNNQTYKEKYQKMEPYIIYVGRIDTAKGCDIMFDFFRKFKNDTESDLKLLVAGKANMELPGDENIIFLGFVSEEEKYAAMTFSKALLLPSEYESLSISVLEAMALGTPVIVNGKCDVLKAHCLKSGTGSFYYNSADFINCIHHYETISSDELEKEREKAKSYVKTNYSWDSIIEKYKSIISETRRKL